MGAHEDPTQHEAIVCGAGAAGLSSAAMLRAAGVETLVLERSDRIAVSWRARYEGLRLNTLGWMSTQPGYHVGRRPRHYPSREAWIDYLERYAAHHRIPIQFKTEVRRIDRANGGWRVQTEDAPLTGRSVVVATGYDREPKMPDWPGRDAYTGELIHAAEYRNTDPYRGGDVLVVSAGVTGSELASFLATDGARRVRVAVRTPPNILRRCRLGVPLNPFALILDRLPSSIGDRATVLSQRIMFGDLSTYGLPRPPLGVMSSVRERRVGPAVDDGFVDAVKKGRIEIVPAVERFEGDGVLLADGERIQPDAVIAATGYERGLGPLVGHLGVLSRRGEPAVERGRAHPSAPGLYFVGYTVRLSGPLRNIRIDAKRVARAIARSRASSYRSRAESALVKRVVARKPDDDYQKVGPTD